MTTSVMAVAKNVRRLRAAKGLTQRELGEKAGVDQATVNRLESERNKDVQLTTLERVAAALDTTPFDLADEKVAGVERPRYRTYSEWFWKTFFTVTSEFVSTSQLLTDEKNLRKRFEGFLAAIHNNDIRVEDKDALWAERERFIP